VRSTEHHWLRHVIGTVACLVAIVSMLPVCPVPSTHAAGMQPLYVCQGGSRVASYSNLQAPDGAVYNIQVAESWPNSNTCNTVYFNWAAVQVVSGSLYLSDTNIYGPLETAWISLTSSPRSQVDTGISYFPCHTAIALSPNWTYVNFQGNVIADQPYNSNMMLCFPNGGSYNTYDTINTVPAV